MHVLGKTYNVMLPFKNVILRYVNQTYFIIRYVNQNYGMDKKSKTSFY